MENSTHIRFYDTGFGPERFGPCEACRQRKGGTYTLITYGKEYKHVCENATHYGISYQSGIYCCHSCTCERLKDAEERGLKYFRRNHTEEEPCCLWPSENRCPECQDQNHKGEGGIG